MMAVLAASFFSGVRPLLMVMLLSFAQHIQAQGQDPITTAPIFLPAYTNATVWSLLRGSILSTNDDETLYTIFCAPVTATTTATTTTWASGEQGVFPACQIFDDDGKFPFTFWEGPSTLQVEHTVEGSYAITEACNLAGTTAATCSGTTSVAATASLEALTDGPFESTLAPTTLTEIAWGVLTLTEPPLTTTVTSGTITSVITYYPTGSDTAVSTETAVATVTPTASTSQDSSSPSSSSDTTGAAASASATPSSAARQSGWEASLLLSAAVSVLLWC
ncbi:hypothetical protein GGR53DRAFT_57520 [Hypoxylon sp. FL1150]|nr:hypothetical protein GGR53DRAFT_57520 [Hypoxylon sp. FL1150]